MSADSTALSKYLSDMPSQFTAVMNALPNMMANEPAHCLGSALGINPKGARLLPTASLAQRLDRFFETGNRERNRFLVFAERGKSSDQFGATKKFFYDRDGLITAPKAKCLVAFCSFKRHCKSLFVIDAQVNVTVTPVSRHQVAIGANNECSGTLLATHQQGSLGARVVPTKTATSFFQRPSIHDNVSAVVKFGFVNSNNPTAGRCDLLAGLGAVNCLLIARTSGQSILNLLTLFQRFDVYSMSNGRPKYKAYSQYKSVHLDIPKRLSVNSSLKKDAARELGRTPIKLSVFNDFRFYKYDSAKEMSHEVNYTLHSDELLTSAPLSDRLNPHTEKTYVRVGPLSIHGVLIPAPQSRVFLWSGAQESRKARRSVGGRTNPVSSGRQKLVLLRSVQFEPRRAA